MRHMLQEGVHHSRIVDDWRSQPGKASWRKGLKGVSINKARGRGPVLRTASAKALRQERAQHSQGMARGQQSDQERKEEETERSASARLQDHEGWKWQWEAIKDSIKAF